MDINNNSQKYHLLLFLIFFGFYVWSAIKPYDIEVWFMEVAPAVVGYIILLITYKKFPLTTLSYFWICFFAIILVIGGHYTYARMPLFEYFKEPPFNATRNHFDRFGHFFQGVMPAIVTRELLIRTSPLKPGKWLFWIVLAIPLAISACYELIEWYAAASGSQDGMAFVGAQGDIWDAQKDMGLCLCGAFTVQVFFNCWQNKQIRKLTGRADI
ncbi:MAG: DUF2238 domain-containing protein [Phycisphaerae bacterium]|nr:DUF2238 domain-containing protein [Phycisphaerae bacterium]